MGIHTPFCRFLYTLEVPRLGGKPAQAGALCWRRHEGRLEVLLVKARSSGRWVLPAGWALRGRPLAATAEREAWEEGGVSGTVANSVLTVVPKRKRYRLAGEIEWQMAVFPLRVDSVADDYPEAGERQRGWFSPEEAAKLVHPSSLGPVLRDVAAGR
ncbi:NUDIX hydrolase [Sphingomonas glaciei]|uniref:NUDIX hydrolase n=1 Tax=Sphingomonas glaciei TaxID=2938948 RepID=A0ABY5MXL2_9SPHN|nr:NUDIX hydrolase [Sphingomonas glaciei]UUR08736.1 NUDIX hydrolase [Sphingomonas glaciei]